MQKETTILAAGLELKNCVALAPMAGITDKTMRRLAAGYGATFTVSEMVSAKAIVMGDKKSRLLLKGGGGDKPYGIQLFGHEPEVLAQAVALLEEEPFDFLDLNMGCPAPKIVGQGAGSGLLKTPVLAGAYAEAAVKASKRPVSVKMRIGWDDGIMTGKEVAKRCEQAGVAFLAIHARTREEMYTPGVHWDVVASIQQAVSIPVLYNGDVDSPEGAKAALRETGCDGLMVGRGATGQPWIFREIVAGLAGAEIPSWPGLRQRMAVMEEQIQGMCQEKGEETAMRQARGVAGAYMRGLEGAAALRNQAHALTYFTDLAQLIEQVYHYNPITSRA